MQRLLYFIVSVFLLQACAQPVQDGPPTLILYNGNFFTADTSGLEASAVAIRGDSIVFVGDTEEALGLAGDQTGLIDLEGAFAMPGFIEGHGHFIGLGQSLENLNLMYTQTWSEIVGLVADKAKDTPAGEWIEGRGWHQEKWTESPGRTVNGYPYHDGLSMVSPQHPVVLKHASGHSLMANQKAMDLAGISSETADPVGGRIVRDAAGHLTGVFEENAMSLITAPLNAWKDQRSEAEKQAAFDRRVELAATACLAKGVTSFQDAGSDFWTLDQFRRLAEAHQLPLRLWVMISAPGRAEFSRLADYPQVGLGDGFLTIRAVKAYLDGALGSYGAWLLQPYSDKPGHFGQNTTPVDSIAALAAQCRKYGLQLCVHAIGDRGNREILDIYEAALQNNEEQPGVMPGLRWRIEHAQHLHPDDIPRFGQLEVIASMQAVHCTSDAPFVVKRLGTERARTGAYAWRSLIDAGAHLANGTDVPVEEVDPLPCIYAAVTRRRADTGLEFFTEQHMTRTEALLSYTSWNAWAAFEETEKGMLAPGKMADIIVLSEDLARCPDESILKTRVLRVFVGGVERELPAVKNPS
ncbi:MAG: amidohydrolase [Bacteroidetes bacterium]|nr:MAG: amidohydrolase [Bacteroidota bacterium]